MAWSSPEAQRYKINYDTTTFVEDNTAGLGIVIRNSEGHALVSLTQQIPLPATVIKTEALAASTQSDGACTGTRFRRHRSGRQQ